MQINSNTEQNLAKAVTTVTVPKRTRSYELCIKADALRFAKSYQESVKTYLESIMMDRFHKEAYWGLALSYKYLKEYQKAIKNLSKLIKIDDQNDEYFYELGVCYLSDGKPECAIPQLVKAIVLNKENLEAQIQLAIAHELVDEADLSLMIYNKLIETNPEFLKAYYNKAAMLMGMGDFKEASKTFFQIIKRNPNYYKAYLGIGMCFDKLEKYPEAIRYYKKFLELLYNNLGFYIGCLMWAAYIKTQPEQEILNNHCLGGEYNEEENTSETDFMIKFLELLPKDMKYFLGISYNVNQEDLKVLEMYREFLVINKGFVNTKTNTDIKLPQGMKTEGAEKFKDIIEEVLEGKNLSRLCDYKNLILQV